MWGPTPEEAVRKPYVMTPPRLPYRPRDLHPEKISAMAVFEMGEFLSPKDNLIREAERRRRSLAARLQLTALGVRKAVHITKPDQLWTLRQFIYANVVRYNEARLSEKAIA